ncbi:MAG: NAD(P) transhydrogenase subunit alpha, partial [Candidatus Electrothrix sp. AS4_5]|nr:NAD(P) transhydrogenase subunit alpha [Candidatus Electrothrix gigas]
VVWNVTPALHTPLMAVTNAISGIIIVGAMIAAGPSEMGLGIILGLIAVALAAVNVFGEQEILFNRSSVFYDSLGFTG